MENQEAALVALELSLLESTTRASAAILEGLLTDDFLEFASTGRSFGRSEVLSRLPAEHGVTFRTYEMRVRSLGLETALVTYTAERTDASGAKHSLRSSLWVLRDGKWRMAFHQGTPVATGVSLSVQADC